MLSTSSPLITIIIPSYNYARFIGETIGSLQAQTCADWECLVVDNGSTDNTREVVREILQKDARIRYLEHIEPRGPSAARNTGIRNASGKYIQFLDADDLIQPRKLACQSDYLDHHPEADLVYSSRRFFKKEGDGELQFITGPDESSIPEVSGDGKTILPFLIRQNIMSMHCPLLRATTIADVGFFDEALPGCEDWDYWIRCALRGKSFHFQNFGDDLALVRVHPTSTSKNFRMMIDTALQMRRKIRADIVEAESARLNEQQIELWADWVNRFDQTVREIREHISGEEKFIFIDQDELKSSWPDAARASAFLEREGKYYGPPADDVAALEELHRQRGAGAKFLVVAWPAFWWLDHYREFAGYLRESFRCLLQNERLVIFDLREQTR